MELSEHQSIYMYISYFMFYVLIYYIYILVDTTQNMQNKTSRMKGKYLTKIFLKIIS